MSPQTETTRARRSEHRRDELLDAAHDLFCDKGVAATAVSDITDKAGVAKGTFYLYFDSKDHIVAGLHGRAIDGMAKIVEDALSRVEGGDFYRVSDELTASIINYWIDQRDLFRAIRESGENLEATQIKAEKDERMISMLEAGIHLGIETGDAAVPNARRAAQFIYYGCQGATTADLLSPGPIDRDELIASSQAVIRKILQP